MKAARLENLVVDAAAEEGVRPSWVRAAVKALHDDPQVPAEYFGRRVRLVAKALLRLADVLELRGS